MSSLLEAANAEPNKIEVTDQLPKRVGDVSIMTVGELFNALEIFHGEDGTNEHIDPSHGYNTSQFYVYGIAGGYGENSTIENLQAVGLDWYRQYNKPTMSLSTFISNGKTVFGGPLESIYYNGWHYLFCYYRTISGVYLSDRSGWDNEVDSSVYVAVVRAHEWGNKVMSSLLEAVNTSSNKIEVTDALPTRVGDVSIMPLHKLYSLCSTDPNNSYNISTYYVYGIFDSTGETGLATGSTVANLQAIGLSWYKQLNKPTTASQTWTQAGHKVFGGPFCSVGGGNRHRDFGWWYATGGSYRSSFSYCWNSYVDTSVYIAVVRAHE